MLPEVPQESLIGNRTFEEWQAETLRHLDAPAVGDRFHEQYSFWVVVTAVTPATVTTAEAGALPRDFPDCAAFVTRTRQEFAQHFRYGTTSGSWVLWSGNQDPEEVARWAPRVEP
jgi:hypothetical protein